MRLRRLQISLVALVMSVPAMAFAEDSPDALRKELDDARNQLKAAQDRKNELATENEKLKAQIVLMQKDVDDIHRDQATWAEQTYMFRVREAAWRIFLDRYPRLKTQWETFLSIGPLEPTNDLPTWPASATATTAPATTEATSQPTFKAATTTMSPATTTATTSPASTTNAATKP